MPELLVSAFLYIKLKKNARIISFSILIYKVEKNAKNN
jgi:hypothetical protein